MNINFQRLLDKLSPFFCFSKNETVFLKNLSENCTKTKFDEVLSVLDCEFNHLYQKLISRTISKNQERQWCIKYIQFLIDRNQKIPWKELTRLSEKDIVKQSDLKLSTRDIGESNIRKLAILKLNGGLGTSMGCNGPKALIEVKDGKNFLDIVYLQKEKIENHFKQPIYLILMNSFNTDRDTQSWINASDRSRILTFNQEAYPKLDLTTSGAASLASSNDEWNPPGHGSVYQSLHDTGVLEKLLSEGIEYLFLSNVDNLGATINFEILGHLIEQNYPFLIEVAPKTKMDVKGGTVVNRNGKKCLLERAQVEIDKLSEFEDIKKFNIFNTNSVWINLKQLKIALQENMILPLIVNQKECEVKDLIQLEFAMGAAIEYFDKAGVVEVQRDRFLPVKKTSDLLLMQSDLFELDQFAIPKKVTNCPLPIINLSDHFSTVSNYQSRFEKMPSLKKCSSLTINGDYFFTENITLEGDVQL